MRMHAHPAWMAVSLLAALVAPLHAEEPKNDAPPPVLLCAVTGTVACDAEGACSQGPAQSVNLPVFLRFDLKERRVTSAAPGAERRSSKITHVGGRGDTLALLGEEGGAAWSATIDRKSGSFTGGIARGGTGYLLFGACLAR